MAESILAACIAHAERTPERPCMTWMGKTLSYAALYRNVLDWAALLRAEGVRAGDRVGLFLASSPDFVAAYLAIHSCHAVAVLINTQYRQVELSHILSDSGAQLVITDEGSEPHLLDVIATHPLLSAVRFLCSDDVAGRSPSADGADETRGAGPRGDDLAVLAYTSGTTGRSKGAMLLHRNLVANSSAVTEAWHWKAEDRLLLTLPLFHIHGLGVGINGSLLVGGSIDLRPRFDAAEVLAALNGGSCTMFFGVPTMYVRLIEEAGGRCISTAEPGGCEPASERSERTCLLSAFRLRFCALEPTNLCRIRGPFRPTYSGTLWYDRNDYEYDQPL
jgi:malonyl-CoA/methylmalonyl-CoA synthetase